MAWILFLCLFVFTQDGESYPGNRLGATNYYETNENSLYVSLPDFPLPLHAESTRNLICNQPHAKANLKVNSIDDVARPDWIERRMALVREYSIARRLCCLLDVSLDALQSCVDGYRRDVINKYCTKELSYDVTSSRAHPCCFSLSSQRYTCFERYHGDVIMPYKVPPRMTYKNYNDVSDEEDGGSLANDVTAGRAATDDVSKYEDNDTLASDKSPSDVIIRHNDEEEMRNDVTPVLLQTDDVTIKMQKYATTTDEVTTQGGHSDDVIVGTARPNIVTSPHSHDVIEKTSHSTVQDVIMDARDVINANSKVKDNASRRNKIKARKPDDVTDANDVENDYVTTSSRQVETLRNQTTLDPTRRRNNNIRSSQQCCHYGVTAGQRNVKKCPVKRFRMFMQRNQDEFIASTQPQRRGCIVAFMRCCKRVLNRARNTSAD